MSLYVDRIDFSSGTPDSRFEQLASAAVADIGSSDHSCMVRDGSLHVYTDFFGYTRHSHQHDYGFRLVETRPTAETTKCLALVGSCGLYNVTDILRCGPEGEGEVVVGTFKKSVTEEQLLRWDASSDSNLNPYTISGSITHDLRAYNAQFENRLVELVREQAGQ